MSEEVQIPLYDPALYEEFMEKISKEEKNSNKKETLLILDISPVDTSIIEI